MAKINRLHAIVCLVSLLIAACTSQSQDGKNAVSNGDRYPESVAEEGTPSQKNVACFIYHRFGEDRYPSTSVSVADFRNHLEYLKKNNFTVMSLGEAIDYLASDSEVEKVAVITVDDGFKSFYTRALPLLKQYKFPATLFINTETVGGGDYMSWGEIKAAMENSVEIGNHTHTHAFFLNTPRQERYKAFKNEIETAQEIISENLGIRTELFAYPYGEFDPEMRSIVKKEGFKAAAAQNSGVIFAGSDRYALPRFPMAEAYADIDKFAEKANMKALRLTHKKPGSYMLPDKQEPPELTITFSGEDLDISRVQCFTQGGTCQVHTATRNDGVVTLSVSAQAPLRARRTLYTITVPSRSGGWYWYSHLWINPDVRE